MECHYSEKIHFIDNKKINVVTTHPLVLTCIETIINRVNVYVMIIQSICNQLYKVNVQFQKFRCFRYILVQDFPLSLSTGRGNAELLPERIRVRSLELCIVVRPVELSTESDAGCPAQSC